MADYTNDGQQRILGLLRFLRGNEFLGVTPTELAKATGSSAALITRDLANLETAGYAERIEETGRWRLGPELIKTAIAFTDHIDQQQRRLTEIRQRYTRTPD